ncbi:FAD-dependent oxidoreductase [Mycolicibacterium sp. 018/SC-01/001]|uniref:flavin monoamine oxidase family protein n=1 Tax=Mycolicibacterium sp. 018/SC-01/001 TaxID=2592069 RepID=UPI00117D723C|nr:NAD(P)/FAD-dependent oxidoreductase [Mycolicibacterium sp. 018/SC-01/001]TRW80291.1 FAD-dependent oxidoreductase [Mycolicibacterium sp. 018/SC-01/001]
MKDDRKMRDVDPEPVIVVGAGLAGLSTAHMLARAGMRTVVLEADERPGGRMHTVTEGLVAGQYGELGAETISADDTEVAALCADLGVELSGPTAEGGAPMTAIDSLLDTHTMVTGGHVVAGSRVAVIRREATMALGTLPPAAHETVAQWLRRAALSGEARALLCAATRALSQRDPAQTDARVLLEDSPRARRTIRGGTRRLTDALARDKDVRLGARATVIRQRRGRITVSLDDGQTLSAKQAVVAVSPFVLGAIGFDPPLPPATLLAAISTPRSQGSTVVAQYREAAALHGLLAQGVCSDGPISRAWLGTAETDGTAVVRALVCGTARARVEQCDAALDELDALLETVVGRRLTRLGGRVKNWSADESFLGMGGAPPITLRGSHVALLAAAERRVHFAGAHTDEMFCDTLEGAVRSGQRAAREVLRHPVRFSTDDCNLKLVRA